MEPKDFFKFVQGHPVKATDGATGTARVLLTWEERQVIIVETPEGNRQYDPCELEIVEDGES